jgi:hypothetical protein
MSEDTPPEPPAQPPQQPQFNPQSGYPSGQPPYPAQYPAAGAPNPYAQPPGAQPGMPFPIYVVPDHPRATAALVIGIVSVAGAFLCLVPILASPVAWVLGAQARKEIRTAPQQWSGEGRATAGMVLGIIGTVLLVLAVLAIAIVVIVAVNDPTTFDDNTGV